MILKRLARWLGYTVMGAIVLMVAFVLVASRLGWEFDAVLSGSMVPVFEVGGLIVVKPVEASTVEAGDVISFKWPGIDTPVCHRVIEKSEVDGNLFFLTKGDANEEPDALLVAAQDVTGKTVLHIPYVGYLGYLAQAGRTPVTLLGRSFPAAMLVILPMGMTFIGLTLREMHEDIFRPSKRRRREALKRQQEKLHRQKKMFGAG